MKLETHIKKISQAKSKITASHYFIFLQYFTYVKAITTAYLVNVTYSEDSNIWFSSESLSPVPLLPLLNFLRWNRGVPSKEFLIFDNRRHGLEVLTVLPVKNNEHLWNVMYRIKTNILRNVMHKIKTVPVLRLFVDVFAEPTLELELIPVSGIIFEPARECREFLWRCCKSFSFIKNTY